MNDAFKILLDYDGVLTKSVDFAHEVGKKYDISEDPIRNFFKNHLETSLRGEIDLIESLSREKEELGWSGSAQSLFNALYVETQEYNEQILEFIRSTISHQHDVYIATNQDFHRHELIRKDELLTPFVKDVFSSCKIGYAKPSSAYFQRIYQILKDKYANIEKESCVFIDDLPQNIEVAEEYGFQTHLFVETRDFINFYNNLSKGNTFPILGSGKLRLVKMKLSHAKGYSDILSEPQTYQYLTDGPPVDEAGAKHKIITNRNACDTGRSIYWSIEGEGDGYLGFIAIHNYHAEKVFISYGVHPAHRRKGVATQSLNIVLNWSGLKGKEIELGTHKENTASYKLLSKLDVKYAGFKQTKFGERHVFKK